MAAIHPEGALADLENAMRELGMAEQIIYLRDAISRGDACQVDLIMQRVSHALLVSLGDSSSSDRSD